MLGESAVDDDHQRRIGAVRVSEVATAQERDACGREVIAHHTRGPGQIQASALGRNVALRNEGVAAVPSPVGQQVGDADGLHAGQLLQLAEQR